MMEIDLNIPLIQVSTGKEVVAYLDELRQTKSNVIIYESLLEAVDQEILSRQAFGIFLTSSACLDTIALCINSSPSRFVRHRGITQFGKALSNHEQWESAWRAVGGTKGLIDIFAKISVTEVKALARAIGRCNRGQHRVEERERCIEGLLHALLPLDYPGSKIQTHEQRPLQEYYAQMVPACSTEFVDQLLDAQDQSNPLYKYLPANRLIKTHGELLQRRIFEAISGNGRKDEHIDQYLKAFIDSEPRWPSSDPKVSASMEFAMKVLQLRLANIENKRGWLFARSQADILFGLLRRSLRRKFSEASLHEVIMLGLKLVEAQPQLKPAFQQGKIWSQLITRWIKAPKLYEDSVVLALRVGLGGSQQTIGQDYYNTPQVLSLSPELRWLLLRLYCLHVPKSGFDIETAKDFQQLANQKWPSDIFYWLRKDKAIQLLKGLQKVNPEYCFLAGPAGTTILSNQVILTQRNFNVLLLLTMLQGDSEHTQMRATRVTDEFRRKSATAREQSDRAQFAKAASACAIASGNLELYGETVTWQQRYVRDPLTVKVIFGNPAVLTDEGIELLSGIPQPLQEDMTLIEIASRVKKANEILMCFHDTFLMAKREPSFHAPDWSGVTMLFGKVISQRVAHAEDLQKRLQGPDANVYTEIWSGTLALLEKVHHDFLTQAQGPIRALFKTLPPTALATATEAMLDSGNERRMEQDRQPGDHILESLSYHLLKLLSKGDKPDLAQRLVLRTILDRPDASSWHRQLLSVSFINYLSAKEANDMLLAFATAISEKLEEQSYVKVGESQPAQSTIPQSLVKVTTVKYLAQLLENAKFISADAAVEVLVELFKAGTHRDIRLATLHGLLSTLNKLCSGADENWRSNSVVRIIMEALDTVVPVVGSINERHPPRLEDWEEARKTGLIPEVSDTTAGSPPLLEALITASDASQYPGLKKLKAEFVTRFILPILEHSQKEHDKWVTLFLNKHRVDLDLDELPRTPITAQLLATLVVRYSDLIPLTVLEDFNEYIVMTIAQPAALKDFNKSLRKDLDISNTPEVQHWLSVFGQSMDGSFLFGQGRSKHLVVGRSKDHYSYSGTQILVRMIHHDSPRSLVRNGITFGRVLEMVATHASLFLDDYEIYADIWNEFVNDLHHPTMTTHPRKDAVAIRSMVSAWQITGRLLLEKVTALVLDKKAKHTREGKRSILPSSTKLRIWLLPFPSFADNSNVDDECKTFVLELDQLLNALLEGDDNVLRWPKIVEETFTISALLNTAEDRLRVALYVGALREPIDRASDQRSSALNFVRVALAMKLIEDGLGGIKKSGEKDLAQGIVKRIEGWQNNINEDIREKVTDWKRKRKEIWQLLLSAE